jgi:hypothetical protein
MSNDERRIPPGTAHLNPYQTHGFNKPAGGRIKMASVPINQRTPKDLPIEQPKPEPVARSKKRSRSATANN